MAIVRLEALARLGFHGIVAAAFQRHIHAAIRPGGDGFHQSAIADTADLEGGVGDTLGFVRRIHFHQLQPTDGSIIIAIGNPPLLSQLDWDSQGGLSPASHRACDFHRTRRSINANYLLRVCEITSLSL